MSVSTQLVVESVLGLAGFIKAGEAPAPEDQALAVRIINGLLGELSINRTFNPNIWTGVVTPANPGVVVLSIDPLVSADFTQDLVYIDKLTCELGPVVYNPRRISVPEYESISVKTTTAIPNVWAWDQQETTSRIYLFPQCLGNVGVRITGVPRIQITQSQGTIAMDSAYTNLIIYNSYLRLYPYFPQPGGIDPVAAGIARDTLKSLAQRTADAHNGPVRSAFGVGGTSSYWMSPLNTVTQ